MKMPRTAIVTEQHAVLGREILFQCLHFGIGQRDILLARHVDDWRTLADREIIQLRHGSS